MAGLSYPISADASKFEAAMKRAGDSVVRHSLEMGQRFTAVAASVEGTTRAIARIPSVASGLGTAVAAILALKIAMEVTNAAVNAAKDNLSDLVKIGSDARASGVGTSFFQAWTLQARELNIEASKLEAALTRAREAGSVRLGENGKAASSDILDRLGEHEKAGNVRGSEVAAVRDAADQEARIRAILDLITRLRNEGAQLAAFDIAGKFFGADFEKQLRSGVDLVAQMRQALDGMAVASGERIVSSEEIRNAERIQAQLVLIGNLMAQGLAPIQRDLVAFGQQQYQGWLDIKQVIAQVVGEAGRLYTAVKGVLDAIDKITGSNPLGTLATKLGGSALGGVLGNPLKPLAGAFTPKEVQGPPPPLAINVDPRRDKSRSLVGKPAGGGGAGETQDAVGSYIQSLERSTAALKAEVDAYGKSNEQKQIAIALARGEEIAKQRGSALTEEEIRRLEAVGAAAGRARDKMAELQQRSAQTAEMLRGMGQIGVDAIEGMILEGKSFEDVLGSLIKRLASFAIQAAVLGTGPLAGLFGTSAAPGGVGAGSVGGLIGLVGGLLPGRAAGGPVTGGQPYLIGERGPEIMVPNASGMVVPNDALRRGGGGFTVQIGGTTIDARGADPGVEARLQVALDQRDRRIAAALPTMVRDASRRGAF